MTTELTREQQDRILAEHGVTVGPDEFVVFEGEDFTVYRMVLKPPPNRQERRAQRAAGRRERRSS
jgi:hypothetical protein